MQRNKDLPASSVHPIQDKFGQVILMTGFTKQEAVALELLKTMILKDNENEFYELESMQDLLDDIISDCYFVAEKFCSYLENKGEKEGGIIQNV